MAGVNALTDLGIKAALRAGKTAEKPQAPERRRRPAPAAVREGGGSHWLAAGGTASNGKPATDAEPGHLPGGAPVLAQGAAQMPTSAPQDCCARAPTRATCAEGREG